MEDIVWRNKGTVDRIMGEALMSFWGAPLPAKDHALRAVVAALDIVQAVEDLRGVLVLPGGARFDVAIGLNTGPMIVGNLGSTDSLNYTVLGDSVHLGSRLKSLNKHYGTKVVISESTFEQVRELVFCRELDTIQVEGKTRPVTIYEPMGMRRLDSDRRAGRDRRGKLTLKKRIVKAYVLLKEGDRRREDRRSGSARLVVRPEQEEVKTMYEHALQLYRSGDFDGARMGFEHVLALNPNDGPARLMNGRVKKLTEKSADEAVPTFTPIFKYDDK
jgi:hypothetical protein